MDYIIETENLTKRYGTATVVDKVNLHVPKGKIYGLLGRNGAGKTTAMKMMLQLAFPTEGTVRLFGTNYKENIHTLYSKVGSIIETPGFYSNLTGYENLQILAKLRGGVSKSGVEKALEVVGRCTQRAARDHESLFRLFPRNEATAWYCRRHYARAGAFNT